MPLAYKDFAPFFKFISNDYIYTANKTITASRIVFWDDTVLDGNVTLFINNARIGNTNRRIRRRLTYPCNQMSYRVRTNKDQNLLLLPGTIVPPGRLPLAAMSNTINLASGYSFGTTVDNVGRSLRDTTIDPNDETFNQQNVLMPVDGYIRLGTKNKIIPINGASFLKTIALGIRVAIKETDKSIVDGNCQVILYENTLKYQTRIAKYITCTIMNIVQGEPPFDLVGIFQCTRGKNIVIPRCGYGQTVNIRVDSENKIVYVISSGDVIIPEGGVGDVSNPNVSIYRYPNGSTIWGLTSDGAMSIYYYTGTDSFTIKTEGTKFFYQDKNTIPVTQLIFSTSVTSKPVNSFYNDIYSISDAWIAGLIKDSIVVIEQVEGNALIGPFGFNYAIAVPNYMSVTFENNSMTDGHGYIFSFISLNLDLVDENPLAKINGAFKFNNTIRLETNETYTLSYINSHYNVEFETSASITFGSGVIGNVTKIDIDLSNGYNDLTIIIIGGSATLIDEYSNELSVGPDNITNITYQFDNAFMSGGAINCNIMSTWTNNSGSVMDITYMGSTITIADSQTFGPQISKYI